MPESGFNATSVHLRFDLPQHGAGALYTFPLFADTRQVLVTVGVNVDSRALSLSYTHTHIHTHSLSHAHATHTHKDTHTHTPGDGDGGGECRQSGCILSLSH